MIPPHIEGEESPKESIRSPPTVGVNILPILSAESLIPIVTPTSSFRTVFVRALEMQVTVTEFATTNGIMTASKTMMLLEAARERSESAETKQPPKMSSASEKRLERKPIAKV